MWIVIVHYFVGSFTELVVHVAFDAGKEQTINPSFSFCCNVLPVSFVIRMIVTDKRKVECCT